ncbi:UNKNOWN [Stylonychia lemnae]|uniref:Uncharacterized protein n=1 Tax=Stylonychia lemnae TaxID=5949 RepID=A0A078A5R2_STYLE|nr:UNKNOWN [Stylonychia lemnae]|eukprot:CDW77524.1 UNKNOWN [Stylonychia lemnae]
MQDTLNNNFQQVHFKTLDDFRDSGVAERTIQTRYQHYIQKRNHALGLIQIRLADSESIKRAMKNRESQNNSLIQSKMMMRKSQQTASMSTAQHTNNNMQTMTSNGFSQESKRKNKLLSLSFAIHDSNFVTQYQPIAMNESFQKSNDLQQSQRRYAANTNIHGQRLAVDSFGSFGRNLIQPKLSSISMARNLQPIQQHHQDDRDVRVRKIAARNTNLDFSKIMQMKLEKEEQQRILWQQKNENLQSKFQQELIKFKDKIQQRKLRLKKYEDKIKDVKAINEYKFQKVESKRQLYKQNYLNMSLDRERENQGKHLKFFEESKSILQKNEKRLNESRKQLSIQRLSRAQSKNRMRSNYDTISNRSKLSSRGNQRRDEVINRKIQSAKNYSQKQMDGYQRFSEYINDLNQSNFERVVLKTNKLLQKQKNKSKTLEEKGSRLKHHNTSRLDQFKAAHKDLKHKLDQKHQELLQTHEKQSDNVQLTKSILSEFRMQKKDMVNLKQQDFLRNSQIERRRLNEFQEKVLLKQKDKSSHVSSMREKSGDLYNVRVQNNSLKRNQYSLKNQFIQFHNTLGNLQFGFTDIISKSSRVKKNKDLVLDSTQPEK